MVDPHPFTARKATGWRADFAFLPSCRWPGVIKAGAIFNQFFAHEDFLPTFAAAGGNPNIVAECLTNCKSGKQVFSRSS